MISAYLNKEEGVVNNLLVNMWMTDSLSTNTAVDNISFNGTCGKRVEIVCVSDNNAYFEAIF